MGGVVTLFAQELRDCQEHTQVIKRQYRFGQHQDVVVVGCVMDGCLSWKGFQIQHSDVLAPRKPR